MQIRKYLPALVNATKEDDDYVFISYSHQDNKIVLEDLDHLAKKGVVFWYDNGLKGGDNWLKTVEDVVLDDDCKAMVFYVSKSFLQSKSIIKEIHILHKKLEVCPEFKAIPILIGMENVFKTLLTLDIEEEDFLLLANTFKSDLLYLVKNNRKFYHMEQFLNTLEPLNVVKKRHNISSYDNITYVNYKYKNVSGLQIHSYNGMETNLIIPSYINGEPVISIGDGAFEGKNNLDSLILSEGLLEICDKAFNKCSNLTFVNIPTTLQEIGYEAFRDCSNLEVIVIPTSTRHIADYCFYRCHGLKTVIINSQKNIKIGFASFSECISLNKITLPEKVGVIDHYCFNKCESLTSITLPKYVDKIGSDIFINCSNLEHVYIDLENPIDNPGLFKFCHNLKSIIFNTDNYSLFYNDKTWDIRKHLFKVRLEKPYGLKVVNNTIQWKSNNKNCKYLLTIKTTEVDEYIVENNYFEFDFVKNTSYTIRVCAIDEEHEELNSEFTESLLLDYEIENFLLVEDGKVLKEYKDCNDEIIFIPDCVEIIGRKAFSHQQNIKEVYLGKNVKVIEEEAFSKCRNLRKIHFNSSLETIGLRAFEFCVSIESLTFPSSLKNIDKEAFICCDDIAFIDYRKCKIYEIKPKTYYRCIKLLKVYWNKNMKIIGDGAFRGCIKYDFSKLPESLKVIGPNTFSFNIYGDKMTIPSTVEEIGDSFLYYATGVKKVTVSEENKNFYSINGVLYNHKHELVYLPVNRSNLNYTTISQCKHLLPGSILEGELLETLNLRNVESVSNNCFNWCRNLKSITFGQNIKMIGDYCFNNCRDLTSITILANEAISLGKNCFRNSKPNVTIYVKKELVATYKRKRNWQGCIFKQLPN